jgi:uncharacterized protein Veg
MRYSHHLKTKGHCRTHEGKLVQLSAMGERERRKTHEGI